MLRLSLLLHFLHGFDGIVSSFVLPLGHGRSCQKSLYCSHPTFLRRSITAGSANARVSRRAPRQIAAFAAEGGSAAEQELTAAREAAEVRLKGEYVASLNKWLESNGCSRAKVSLGIADAQHGGGVGLRLAEGSQANKGDVLVSIPFSLSMTASSARDCPAIGAAIAEFDGWTGAAGLIACQLMHEMRLHRSGEGSRWGP